MKRRIINTNWIKPRYVELPVSHTGQDSPGTHGDTFFPADEVS